MTHVVRMGAGAYLKAIEKNIKSVFYTLRDNGEYEVVDNRKGKMLKYTCATLDEIAECVK